MKIWKVSVIATHIAGWLLFQSLPLVFLLSQSGTDHLGDILGSWQYWQFCLFYVGLYYLNSYFLLPRFFVKGKKFIYTIVILLLALSVYKLEPFEQLMIHSRNIHRNDLISDETRFSSLPPERGEHRMPSSQGNRRPRGEMRHGGNRLDIISIFIFLLILTLSTAMDLNRRWRLTEQRAAQAETDKANAELSFLKAQINPHFLFNTLNNIYSMAVTKNENTAGTIMKLSNIMRYVTDEVNEDYVSLQSEIDCISDYIDLQSLRLGKKVTLEYTVTGALENKRIAPLILMSFIENMFKYGISNHQESHLALKISVEDISIHFFAQNQLFAQPRKLERTGIGISNTRKRLEQLYPNNHQLKIARENSLFIVDLRLGYPYQA